MRRLPKLQGGSDAKLTSTFETSCFNRILDCDTADDSNDHLDQSSALLLHDAELVDRPHEVHNKVQLSLVSCRWDFCFSAVARCW